jgi:hypothetical protein
MIQLCFSVVPLTFPARFEQTKTKKGHKISCGEKGKGALDIHGLLKVISLRTLESG